MVIAATLYRSSSGRSAGPIAKQSIFIMMNDGDTADEDDYGGNVVEC